MRTIDEAVGRVSSIIVEVANASSEQAEGIRQVNQAVSHLDGATQQNAALVEQAAATAQRLAEQADVLDAVVRLFTVAEAASLQRAGSGGARRAVAPDAVNRMAPDFPATVRKDIREARTTSSRKQRHWSDGSALVPPRQPSIGASG